MNAVGIYNISIEVTQGFTVKTIARELSKWDCEEWIKLPHLLLQRNTM
jgi:hypothetical protein